MDDREHRWLQRAREGEAEAFEPVVQTYARDVFGLCYRMLGDAAAAEDAAQEVFWRAYRALGRYDASRPFRPWLLTIASRYCLDRLRRERRRSWLPLNDRLRDRAPSPEEALLQREQEADLQRALLALRPKERAVLVLHYWHDCSLQEIAAITGSSPSAVKSRLFRARRVLAQRLRGAEIAPGKEHA